MRVRAARACWCTVRPVRTPGSLARRMIRCTLVMQAEGFGVADGGGQHGLGGVLVSGSGEQLSGGDPLEDPPARGRRLAASRAAPGKISSLGGTPGRQQPAIAGAITLVITGLSKQRTKRIKHAQDTELEREFLRSAMAAYERAAADSRAPDSVDLTLALQGALTGRQDSGRQGLPCGRAGRAAQASGR